MKYFKYSITDNEIKQSQGEIQVIPTDFIEYKMDLMGEGVYYKVVAGKLTEVIGEGGKEETAHRRVEDFLSAFNVSLV